MVYTLASSRTSRLQSIIITTSHATIYSLALILACSVTRTTKEWWENAFQRRISHQFLRKTHCVFFVVSSIFYVFYCGIHHGIKFIRVEIRGSDKETKDVPSVKLSPFRAFSPLV